MQYKSIKEVNVLNNLSLELKEAIKNVDKPYKKIIFICIGTDRCTGDSYGPIVGDILKKQGFEVYGTLHHPVHALNLEMVLRNIDIKNNLIIAVDATLGNSQHVGKIRIKNEPCKPGQGVGKKLTPVGDIKVIGIVNESTGIADYNNEVLKETRLSIVYDLALETANIISKAMKEENKKVEAL